MIAWARRLAGFTLPRSVHVDPKLVLGLGLLFALLTGLLLVWLFGAYARVEARIDQALMKAENERVLRLASLAVTESVAGVMSDLRYIGHHNELDALLRTGSAAAAHDLAREYAAILGQKRDYDQIRLLDLAGMERIRVDQVPGGAAITPAAQLQAKRARYYFEAMAKLGGQEIYVSPMDLNVEHEQISQPLKPMLRVGMPVHDDRGVRRGYVVINYLAERLLAKIRGVAGGDRTLWLIDSAGEWLAGPTPEDAWSGQLPERRQRGFARVHPDAWATMSGQSAGSLTMAGASYQFARVYPLRALGPVADGSALARPEAAESYHWYLVVAENPATMSAGHARLADMTLKGGGVLALLLLALSFALAYAIARQRSLAMTLEQVVDNLPVLIAYIDAGQRFRFNNRAYLDAYGLTPRRLYGQPVRAVLGEDAYGQARPHLEQALAGHHVEFEMHLETGPGPRDLAVGFVPDLVGKTQVRGVYALITDITARKASESREREHLLAMAQVARMASVGEITAEIAHQMNQPLAAIAMFSNAAQRTIENGGDTDKLRDWMATINSQAKRASDVVQRLRRFARSDDFNPVPVDLNAPVREAVALLEPVAHASKVALSLDLADGLPAVLASAVLMEQVVYNLAHAAIRTAQGQSPGGRVVLRSLADQERVRVEIIGTVQELELESKQSKITYIVGQPEEGQCNELSISRDIVNSYHGDMDCRRIEGGGVLIWFSLPVIKP
ncbi:MAG: PAS domain-containing protein [Thiobacillus sp.]|nr:PAS domain-containing protein [Thiobacillus sp.]